MAKAVEAAGADALTVCNTFLGMAIDVEHRRPLLGNITGGLSGAAIRPIALRLVYQTAKAVSIPIIGCGGIQTGEDAAAFLLAGASAIQVGAENFRNPRAVVRVAEELDEYLERHQVAQVRELVGALDA